MPPVGGSGIRPLTVIVWMLVFVVLLIGGWKLFHLDRRSPDQRILIHHEKKH